MTCPCPDPACGDVHAHDVTGVLAMTIDVTELLSGVLEGDGGGTQPAVV